MLAWNADYWSITFYASGEALEIAFYPMYINTPSMSESSTDDEQPGPSNLVSNSEGRAGGSSTSESSTDDEQPGPSALVNNSEGRAGRSRTSADQSSGGQLKTRQGFKSKREHGRSESRLRKKRRLDHNPNSLPMFIDNSPEARWETHMSGSSTDDEQPGPSNLVNSCKARPGGSRAPDRSERREWKRWRPDHWSDSDDSLSSGFSSPALLEETSSDDKQPEPSHRENSEARVSADQIKQEKSSDHQSDSLMDSLISEFSQMYISTPPETCGKMKSSNKDDELSQLVNNSEVRAEGSRASSDQSSDSQDEMRQGVKRKRKTSSRSESRENTKNGLDHRSGSDSIDDQADPSVRDNNEARAGGSRAPSDQSSGSQMETRQGLKRKRKTSDRPESREQKPRRSGRHK
ncbi:transcriptional regulator ATRX homolog [Cyprinus carpio]|uniref:Transcriptional regulator ATRX homolog n=1 Tax=Cyprinus carpio TaxID=7962 RepID=A0A9Q9XRG3_CYPCA|nr:transcriptional regulator ATRX homolog [Cyprinus carpio]